MTDAATDRKFLIFSLAATRYALDLVHVAEVIDPPQLSPIPLVPACYSGALNFHGEIVAVIDLARLLGLTNSKLPEKVIVLHSDVASLAFLVESTAKIVSAHDLTITIPSDRQYCVATLELMSGSAYCFDVELLVIKAETILQRH